MHGTRFTLLPVGARFEYEGKWYVKSTPLIATAADGGGQRMVPRSALVAVEAGAAPPPRPVPEAVATAALLEALGRYHAEAVACLETADRQAAVARLDAARQALLEGLGLSQ
jgi:hypothetical protein